MTDRYMTSRQIRDHHVRITAMQDLVKAVDTYDGRSVADDIIAGAGDVFVTCIAEGPDQSHSRALGIGRGVEVSSMPKDQTKVWLLGKVVSVVAFHTKQDIHPTTLTRLFSTTTERSNSYSAGGAHILRSVFLDESNILAVRLKRALPDMRNHIRAIASRAIHAGGEYLSQDEKTAYRQKFGLAQETTF